MKTFNPVKALLDLGYTPQAQAIAEAYVINDVAEVGRLTCAALDHMQAQFDQDQADEFTTDSALARMLRSIKPPSPVSQDTGD